MGEALLRASPLSGAIPSARRGSPPLTSRSVPTPPRIPRRPQSPPSEPGGPFPAAPCPLADRLPSPFLTPSTLTFPARPPRGSPPPAPAPRPVAASPAEGVPHAAAPAGTRLSPRKALDWRWQPRRVHPRTVAAPRRGSSGCQRRGKD